LKLAIIIPTFQEEANIQNMVLNTSVFLDENHIDYEIIIVDDHSSDSTRNIISTLSKQNDRIKLFLNNKKKGFGNSIVMGLDKTKAELITIMMADNSDSLNDLKSYYDIMNSEMNLDCVFGDRWRNKSIKNYPVLKKILNRAGNKFIAKLFNVKYYDFTNSFKIYKRSSLLKIYPILSNHFSITVELPLKMITRKFNYKIIDNSWENREHGVSKMRIFNSVVTYLIIITYCLIDKYFWNKRYESNG